MQKNAKKCQVIGVQSMKLGLVLNFQECIFCQSDRINDATGEKDILLKPTEQGYASLGRDISGFIKGSFDIPKLIFEVFHDQNQFEKICKERNAQYHRFCRNQYSSLQLDRLEGKRKKAQTEGLKNDELCIFCEKPEKKNQRFSTVSSRDIISKIINLAERNNDHLLQQRITNSSEQSSIKYHKYCYNKHFNTKNDAKTKNDPKNDFQDAYDIVLTETIDEIEKTRDYQEQVFFKLSQLAKEMSNRLSQMGFENCTVHSSRLKEQLQSLISGLRADKIGREIFLFFDDNVKHLVANAIENDLDDDEKILEKAIVIIRQRINTENAVHFSGSLNKTFCAEKTTSKTLVKFVSSLLEGRESNSKIAKDIAENIAQIIEFNCVKRRKSGVEHARHNIEREQPLTIYLGLMIHSETGQRKLVDELNRMGLSISYSRVMDIERALATKVCEKYIQDDCVCPPSLTKGIFTTAAIDNIDHNPSSSSANYSFHGTGISLIQHFNHHHSEESKQYVTLEKSDFSNKRKPSLPDSYYNIPLVPSIAGEPPVSTVNWYVDRQTVNNDNPLEYTKDWLKNCTKLMDENEKSYENIISWGAYNSRHSEDISSYKSTSAMLPLLKDDINSPAVVMHSMDIVIAGIKKLNPTQTPVMTADEPVYAIAKQIQWTYPEKYGEDKMVVMLGN